MNKINELKSLNNWFLENRKNKDSNYVSIEFGTLENPGWCLFVNLIGTEYEKIDIPNQFIENSDDDWISYNTEDGFFKVFGGPFKLKDILLLFIDLFPKYSIQNIDDLNIKFLQKWYYNECNGDWEHSNGMSFIAQKERWDVKISLFETQWEPLLNELNNQNLSYQNFVCDDEDKCFIARGTSDSLTNIVSYFRKWILERSDPETRVALELIE